MVLGDKLRKRLSTLKDRKEKKRAAKKKELADNPELAMWNAQQRRPKSWSTNDILVGIVITFVFVKLIHYYHLPEHCPEFLMALVPTWIQPHQNGKVTFPVKVDTVPRLPKLPQEGKRWAVTCSSQYKKMKDAPFVAGCHPHGKAKCARIIKDDFATKEEVDALLQIAAKGMKRMKSTGGPTIMDINSGFVRDGEGLVNLYDEKDKNMVKNLFTKDEYKLYGDVIEKIRKQIMTEFDLDTLHFTAPTFITREVGGGGWEPKSEHDEYWHPHVDKNNTAHYDYSGLLYLADYGEDFQGGLFSFLDGRRPPQAVGCYDRDLKEAGAPNTCVEYAKAGYCTKKSEDGTSIKDWCPKSCDACEDRTKDEDERCLSKRGCKTTFVEPSRGRLAMFSSGQENLHGVRRVDSGTRFVMSIWFTCDERKKFANFLDGKMHNVYGEGKEKENEKEKA